MAENTRDQNRPATEKQTERSSGTSSLSRRDPFGGLGGATFSPFASLFRRWNEEMDRLFDDFGFGRTFGPAGSWNKAAVTPWSPQVEVMQRGNDLVVRADLPGLRKEDVHVDVADDLLTIQGERRQEHDEEREGWHHTERSYGSFYRAIPLPEGTITDSAKATFKDGVLEVVLQAPSREVSRGRRLEIR